MIKAFETIRYRPRRGKLLGKLTVAAALLLSTAVNAQSSISMDYRQAKPFDDKLKEITVPNLHTTMVFSGETMVREDSQAVFVLFAGTGAKTSDSGIAQSMQPVAHKVLKLEKEQFKLKADPVGFQNPLYYRDNEGPEARRPFLEKFGNMRAQVDWMNEALKLVVGAIPKDQNGRPLKKVWVITRSTGSALFSQLVDEYYSGRPGLDVVGAIDGAVMMGYLGHTPGEIEKWNGLELEHLKHGTNLSDDLVQPLGAKIFESMTYAPADAQPVPKAEIAKQLPKIIITWGSNDHSSTAEDQLSLAERFSKRHPELSVTLWGADNDHNAAAPSLYTNRDGNAVKVERMKRFSPVMEGIAAYLSGIPRRDLKEASKAIADIASKHGSGLSVYAIPAMFDGPRIESCDLLMARVGAASIIGGATK